MMTMMFGGAAAALSDGFSHAMTVNRRSKTGLIRMACTGR